MGKIFAVPVIDGRLCMHFGHCEKFALVTTENNSIEKIEMVEPPVHQPGVYPRFLAEMGVETIIAGGMGIKAQELFTQNNIEVFVGVGSEEPENLVRKYLSDQLQSGANLCDH
ncbi:MAG: ATPase [Bacteroidales bacterium]|nr:ATPase [Bacteroidales bacterium]